MNDLVSDEDLELVQAVQRGLNTTATAAAR